MKRRKDKHTPHHDAGQPDGENANESQGSQANEPAGPQAPGEPAGAVDPLANEHAEAGAAAETPQEASPLPSGPLTGEVDRLKDQLARAQAEVVNIQRRMQRELELRLRYGIQEFAVDIVGVLDHLHRALEHLRSSGSGDLQAFLSGAEMIEREFVAALGRHGVERIASEGEPFNPDVHDALSMQESPGAEPGTVIAELRAGYKLKDRVIRPAQVIVSKAPEPQEEGGEDGGKNDGDNDGN